MKYIYVLFTLLACSIVNAQLEEEVKVRVAIEQFFYAFNNRNELAIKKLVSPDVLIQTIGLNIQNKMIVRTENFNDLINFIITTPDSISFKEKILDYNIQIDGGMAHVWAPYEFWYNEEFSHCGVNSFQLFKDDDTWKIIYLVDTRRKEECNQVSDKN